MNAARLAEPTLELLGPVGGPVVVVGPEDLRAALARRVAVVADGRGAAAAVVNFLGERPDVVARQARLATLRAELPAGAALVLLDHNQPRTLARRFLGTLALLVRGLGPARARYPAARELAALGFVVEKLRLACGERVQLVAARRR